MKRVVFLLLFALQLPGQTRVERLRQRAVVIDLHEMPNLVRGLMERGFSDAGILKIPGGNTLRVMRAVEQVARSGR